MFKIVFAIALIFLSLSIIPVSAQTLEQQLQSARETYPTGIAANGLNYANNYAHYTVNTNAVIGIAHINSISVNPPNSGAGLQLNVVLHVITTNGTTDYWLQNVIQFGDTNSQTANFLDNIWNLSNPEDTSQICAHTNILKHIVCKILGVYATPTTQFVYQLPFTEELAISEETILGKGVQIQFMYNGEGKASLYDNRMITIPNITSASLLITADNTTNIGLNYDAEFVFGGIGNGETGNFNAMNSTLGLVYNDGSINLAQWETFPSYNNDGYDTAETAQNIYSTINSQNNGTALVELGNPQNQNTAIQTIPSTPPTITNGQQTQPIINTPSYQQNYSPLTISTDKQFYTLGDTIVITGVAASVLPGTPLAIEILDPNNNLVQMTQIDVPSNGQFTESFLASGPLWKADGTYTVKAQNGAQNISAQTTFDLTSTSPQITPQTTPQIVTPSYKVPEFGTLTSVVFLIGVITTMVISVRLRSKTTGV